jgi:hypothetical protein
VILQEKPLFVIRKQHEEIEISDIENAVKRLTMEEKRQFSSVRDNATHEFLNVVMAFSENCFAIPGKPGDLKSAKAYGFFPLHSRINHSCVPNTKIPDNTSAGNRIASHASRDIEAGEEILFCYDPGLSCRTRVDRHHQLRFECKCSACTQGHSYYVVSDMRRILMRGLNYLTLGRDVDGQRFVSMADSLIVDASLKKAAKAHGITLSSRFIYNLLIMALSEQEGLMDALLEKRMRPGIERLVGMFQGGGNKMIANRAMTQETWMEKFCVASVMWGRHDAGDDVLAQQLRMWRASAKE